MMVVFRKTLRDMRGVMIGSALGMGLAGVFFMLMFPSIEQNAADLQEIMDDMGPALQALTGGIGDFTTLNGFLSVKLLSLTYPVILLALVVELAAGLIADEESNRSLDILLSAPLSRWRLALEKYLALVVLVLVVLAGTYAGLVIGGLLAGIERVDYADLLVGVLNLAPFTLFFGALTLCLTAVRPGRGLALAGVAVLASVTYILNALAAITHIPDVLLWFSPWYYYAGAQVLVTGIDTTGAVLLLSLAVFFAGLMMWGIEHRDVGV